jgi:hypothetical protein
MVKSYERFFEMANISSKYTGIIEGTIQIRPEERHKNSPHIHYVHNVKKADNEFVKFSINKEVDKIEVIEIKNLTLTKKETDKVRKFISLNPKKLIRYYKQAELLDTIDLLNSLEKI